MCQPCQVLLSVRVSPERDLQGCPLLRTARLGTKAPDLPSLLARHLPPPEVPSIIRRGQVWRLGDFEVVIPRTTVVWSLPWSSVLTVTGSAQARQSLAGFFLFWVDYIPRQDSSLPRLTWVSRPYPSTSTSKSRPLVSSPSTFHPPFLFSPSDHLLSFSLSLRVSLCVGSSRPATKFNSVLSAVRDSGAGQLVVQYKAVLNIRRFPRQTTETHCTSPLIRRLRAVQSVSSFPCQDQSRPVQDHIRLRRILHFAFCPPPALRCFGSEKETRETSVGNQTSQ